MDNSATLYAIKDWERLYETAETKRYKTLRWVPVPLKHDGKGFRLIMAHPRGAEIFAAWVLMLQVAAKMPKRGVLADEDGPLDALDLAAMTGAKPEIFEISFDLLESKRVGWICKEYVNRKSAQIPVCEAVSTADSQLKTDPPADSQLLTTRNRIELNRTEQNRTVLSTEVHSGIAAVGFNTNRASERAAPAAAESGPDLSTLARAVAGRLMPNHPKPGATGLAVAALERILAESVHPENVASAIERTHAAWVEYWLTLPPSGFRPMLHRWFQDGDYLHPPSRAKPAAAAARKETLGDRLMREANEQEARERAQRN